MSWTLLILLLPWYTLTQSHQVSSVYFVICNSTVVSKLPSVCSNHVIIRLCRARLTAVWSSWYSLWALHWLDAQAQCVHVNMYECYCASAWYLTAHALHSSQCDCLKTASIRSLHWLKILYLTFKILYTTQPPYLYHHHHHHQFFWMKPNTNAKAIHTYRHLQALTGITVRVV